MFKCNTGFVGIKQLGVIKEFNVGMEVVRPANAAVGIADSTEVYVHDAIDPKAEKIRLEKQKSDVEKAKKAAENKLANKKFVEKAKAEVVARARERLSELTEQLKAIEKHLADLSS